MKSKDAGLPGLDELFRAADAHAAEAGDPDYAVGDLQEILLAAWRVLTRAQRREVFSQPELAEYGPLFGRLVHRRG